MTNIIKAKARSNRISQKRIKLRTELWPDLDTNLIYNRKKEAGFTTIPRTMPLILKLMDELSNGKPVSSTFFSLWCRIFDEALIVAKNQQELAFEAGFTGERAVTTWHSRMKILKELGFIDSKSGSSGDYHYVVIFNPHKIIEKLKQDGKLRTSSSYNVFYERILEVGGIKDSETEE